MDKNSKIYVAGHRGMIGSALVRQLEVRGYSNIVARTHAELDLTNQALVGEFFEVERPEYVFLAAAKVGGIHANTVQPAEFMYTSLAIQTSIIHASYQTGVKRLVYFGSNCSYPKECQQPMREEHLLTGYLEQTSEAYALAKIAGMRMCDAYNRQFGTTFFSLIPANVYGPRDNFDSETSHVLGALLGRFHQAKEDNLDTAVVWGTGKPRREFLYVDDLANASIFLVNQDDATLRNAMADCKWVLNCGSGEDLTILELAEVICRTIGFKGEIRNDLSRQDGPMRKLLDSSKIMSVGWSPKISMEEGIRRTYAWYCDIQAARV